MAEAPRSARPRARTPSTSTAPSGVLTVNTEEDADTINVNGTGAGSQTFINAQSGDDIVNVRADRRRHDDQRAARARTPSMSAATPPEPSANASNNSGGNVDGIGALLTINGDGGADVLNVDDTGDSNANTGTLTSTTITGLDMGGSITYGTVETLNIGLGTGGDTFTIESTHAGDDQRERQQRRRHLQCQGDQRGDDGQRRQRLRHVQRRQHWRRRRTATWTRSTRC